MKTNTQNQTQLEKDLEVLAAVKRAQAHEQQQEVDELAHAVCVVGRHIDLMQYVHKDSLDAIYRARKFSAGPWTTVQAAKARQRTPWFDLQEHINALRRAAR